MDGALAAVGVLLILGGFIAQIPMLVTVGVICLIVAFVLLVVTRAPNRRR
jgi:hypothetical protein